MMPSLKKIDKYIAKTVIQSTALVTFLLTALQVFMILIDHLDEVGQGDFTVWQGIFYALMMTPYQIYLFFPVAAMLGCLIGLGILASNSELIVLQAAGVSISRIVLAVLKGLVAFVLLMTLLGETVIPKLVNLAEHRKASLITGGKALSTDKGIWLREGDTFIHVGNVLPGNRIENVMQYTFNQDNQLLKAMHAASAEYVNDHWILHHVKETEFSDQQLTRHQSDRKTWQALLNPKFLLFTRVDPGEMSLGQLRSFIAANQRNFLQTNHFELVFWQRLLQPLSAIIMIVLAIPFIFGPLRSVTMGSRLLVGISVGFTFHLLNKFFGPFSLVYHLPPLLGALGPMLCFGLLSLFLLRSMR